LKLFPLWGYHSLAFINPGTAKFVVERRCPGVPLFKDKNLSAYPPWGVIGKYVTGHIITGKGPARRREKGTVKNVQNKAGDMKQPGLH
jgi:hypothetical protein